MPAVPAHTAIAFCRSVGSEKAFVMIDRVAGKMRAAPTPVTARMAISPPAVSTRAEARQPRPKMTRPAANARRRPNRSPSPPQVSSRPANTTV